ncbi:hypothetical protein [Streptomyces zaomyceticus]|uniref:hypothetical protein n=1 Tax=Streptomyces zaomyceticus TaxID=68286 RepID=UPI0034364AF4
MSIPLRWAAGLRGVTAIAALGLFLSHHYLGLGMAPGASLTRSVRSVGRSVRRCPGRY